jgi:hypothetical protein
MYSFAKRTLGGYTIYISSQKQGDTHIKKFGQNTSPSNQYTTNIYVTGEFLLKAGSWHQIVTGGQTNLDLNIPEFQVGDLVSETVVSPYALRYCVSGEKVLKKVVSLEQSKPYVSDTEYLVFILSGFVNINNCRLGTGAYMLVPTKTDISGTAKLLLLSSAKL